MLKKSQVKKETANGKRPRSQLVIDTTKLILSKYPVKWTAEEISIKTGANIRTVNRILADMTSEGLLERKYHSYTISIEIINQLYGAKWYIRQEMDKQIMLTNKKINQ